MTNVLVLIYFFQFFCENVRCNSQGPDKGGGAGGNARDGTFRGERHFRWKDGTTNGLSRMNLNLDLGLGIRF